MSSEERQRAWLVFFSSVVAMHLHPGNIGTEGVDLDLCSNLADEMLSIMLSKFSE